MSRVGTFWNLRNPQVCLRFVRALVPNIALEVAVPDEDCDGQTFPQLEHVQKFQSLFSELCGGHYPPLAGVSPYQPTGEVAKSEFTVVLKTFLPEEMTDAISQRLLEAIVAFGQETRQQLVLVAVGGFAFRFHFKIRAREEETADVVSRTRVA